MLETTPLVNSASQGILAKLLAKENITVETGNYSTAFFDVKNRILGLPTWNVTSKAVSDLLVGHEVGHALYTPEEGIEKFKQALPNCPFDVINIVEDIRIEKLVQAQYPGLISSFTAGYANFIENDFFKIKGEDVSSLSFINRLNLRGKIGNQLDIPLNDSEEAIYQRCLSTENIDDVIAVCADIYEMVKSELNKQKQESQEESESDKDAPKSPSQPSAGADDGQEAKSEEEKPKASESKAEDAKPEESESTSSEEKAEDAKGEDSKQESKPEAAKEKGEDAKQQYNGGEASNCAAKEVSDAEVNDALKSDTLNNLNQELENMQQTITDYISVIAPSKEQIMKTVVPVAKVMHARTLSVDYHYYFSLAEVTEDWKQFKTSTKQHVNLLVKEFERRKAAYQYSRAQRSTTGSIDVNRLHSYKFEDQIFKSVTKLADAKNHGMIFFIDYSGSMRNDLANVINHTLSLVFFCKAVGIPFEVYGFTNPAVENGLYAHQINHRQISLEHTSVFELINSSMNKADYDLTCRQMRAQSFLYFSDHNLRCGTMPIAGAHERMNGTPLNEAIIVAHELVKRFKAKYHVQKMNAIFLTDGDGGGVYFGGDRTGAEHCKKDSVASYAVPYRLRINGRTINLTRANPSANYSALIENLRITCDTTAIGFFISNSRGQIKTSAINALRHTKGGEIKDWAPAAERVSMMLTAFRKNKCMMIANGFAFNEYFIISSGDLKLDDNENFVDDLDVDMTTSSGRNQMAKAFTKYTSDKRSSRMILNKFAELVA